MLVPVGWGFFLFLSLISSQPGCLSLGYWIIVAVPLEEFIVAGKIVRLNHITKAHLFWNPGWNPGTLNGGSLLHAGSPLGYELQQCQGLNEGGGWLSAFRLM